MITLGAITQIADRDGVDAHVVERDYLLTHMIDALARSDPPEDLVFKGGTALRLCYFPDSRYSADLDFSVSVETLVQAQAAIERAAVLCCTQPGFRAIDVGLQARRIDYIGPLGRPRPVKIDLATDELVIDATRRPLIRRYSDQSDPSSDVLVYSLQEVAAEKLRCVIQRLQCRDLFDLHRLFVEEVLDVDTAWDSFERKARHRGLDPTGFAARLEQRLPHYERRWEDELLTHLGQVPKFEPLVRELRRALRAKL